MDWIFELNSRFGTENLKRFSDLVNKETLWVVSEAGYTSYMVYGEGRRVQHEYIKVQRQDSPVIMRTLSFKGKLLKKVFC